MPHGLDEHAVLVELRDARVAEAVGDEQAAVGQPRDVLRPAEVLVVVAGDVGFAERAHQLLAVVAELVDLMARVVDHPDVLLRIVRADADLVRSAAALEQLVPLASTTSISLPLPSTTTMQLRISGLGSVARWFIDPQMPLKPRGSVSGSLSSPRAAMKIRFGDSAKMPGCDPQM